MSAEKKQGKILPIGPHLGKVKNRVALVGVELEGAWSELPPGVQEVVHDGSVFGGRMPPNARYLGELPIGPALPAGIPELIRINHPQKVNATCGMHVHMSFDTLRWYQLLMTPDYQATILHFLKEWAVENKFRETHCIWERLAGKSRYCQDEFWPDQQATRKQKDHNMDRPGHRYTVIHYCGRQTTIECRVLPMMNSPVKANSAVTRVIDITNACLYLLGKSSKADRFASKIELPDNMVYEESIIQEL